MLTCKMIKKIFLYLSIISIILLGVFTYDFLKDMSSIANLPSTPISEGSSYSNNSHSSTNEGYSSGFSTSLSVGTSSAIGESIATSLKKSKVMFNKLNLNNSLSKVSCSSTSYNKVYSSIVFAKNEKINYYEKPKSETYQKFLEKVKNRTVNVVVLGDSLSDGYGNNEDRSYYSYAIRNFFEHQTVTNFKISNFAQLGYKTKNVNKILEQENVQNRLKETDVIFLTVGGNDLMGIARKNVKIVKNKEKFTEITTVEKDKYAERLRHTISTIRSHNKDAPIYFVGLYNPFKKYNFMFPELKEVITIWNQTSEEVLSDYEYTTFVPVFDIFEEEDDVLYKDDFHPNHKGYVLMGERVYQYMRK